MRREYVANVSHRKGERGSVLAYTVVSTLCLLLGVGLAVDLGHLYTAKAEMQNASDAAALAGAYPLDQNDGVKIHRSVCNALKLLNLNKYNFDNRVFFDPADLAPCADPAVDVKTLPAELKETIRYAKNLSEFDIGDGKTVDEAVDEPHDIRFIRVTTPPRPISIFFAILPGFGAQRNLSARAVAGYSVPGNTSFCILPMTAVSCDPGDADCRLECRKFDDPTTEEDDREPGCKCDPTKPDYPMGQPECKKYWGECPGNPDYEPIDVEPGGLDPDGDGKCDPQREFCKGCKYMIRAEPARGPAAGAFNLLACAGEGGCELRKAIAAWEKCQCQANVGENIEVFTKSGGNQGPVRQGLNVRFDIYACDPTDEECGDCALDPATYPPDMNVAQPINWNDYFTNSITDPPPDNPPGAPKRRVLIIPIVPVTQFTDGQGRQLVKPSGFGGFFLREQVPNGMGHDGGAIKVEYIAEDIVDVIGFDPMGEKVTNIVTPVLYR